MDTTSRYTLPSFSPLLHPHARSFKVRRVQVVLQPNKIFLDTPRRHEAIENRHAARLVVRPARACTPERLLAHDGARALLVVVHVPGGVAQTVRRLDEGLAVRSEAATAMRIRSRYLVGTGLLTLRRSNRTA